MLSNETRISGIQICLVVIASMAVPPVFIHMVLSPTLPAIQKEQTAVCRAPQRAMMSVSNIDNASFQLCNADDDWTSFPYVTAKADTTSYVEGAASVKLKIEDGFNSGLIASSDIKNSNRKPSLNDCNQITFWIKSNIELDDDIIQLRLYVDDGKASTGECFSISGNALDGSNWKKVTLDLSDTDITENFDGSIAMYAAEDPGPVTIWIDIVEITSSASVLDLLEFQLNELVYAPAKGVFLAG